MNLTDFIKNKNLRERISKYREVVSNTWKKENTDDSIPCVTKKISKDGVGLIDMEKYIAKKIDSAQPFDPTKILFFNTETEKVEKIFPLEDITTLFFISDVFVDNIIDKMMEDGNNDIVIGICGNNVKIAITDSMIEKCYDIIDNLTRVDTYNSMCKMSNKNYSYYISEHILDDSKVKWFNNATFNAYLNAITDTVDFPIIKSDDSSEKLKESSLYGKITISHDEKELQSKYGGCRSILFGTKDLHCDKAPDIREVLLVSNNFVVPDELTEFVKSIGYNSMADVCLEYEYAIFDHRIIEFIKSKLIGNLDLYHGVRGVIHLTKVNITNTWEICYSCCFGVWVPEIMYVDYHITQNDYNKVTCKIIRKYYQLENENFD